MDGYGAIKINQMQSGLYRVEIIGMNNEILLEKENVPFCEAVSFIGESCPAERRNDDEEKALCEREI